MELDGRVTKHEPPPTHSIVMQGEQFSMEVEYTFTELDDRTPKLNTGQSGIPIPGRDHWGQAMSVILAGGGLKTGQVIGATNSKAEHPITRPLKPDDVLATIYTVLGIDPQTSFKDFAGRPVPLIDHGQAIKEIL